MGYQFARTATYSRKGTSKSRAIADVAAELDRQEGACPHVDQPRDPTVLAGMQPSEIPDEIDRRAREQRRALRGQLGRGGGIRRDQHIAEGAVFSHPYTVADIEADNDAYATYQAWRDDTVAWAQREMAERGLDVLSVVEHHDETHPHIHVVAIPRADANPKLDARECHPGAAAKRQAERASEAKPDQHYRAAMRQWQDAYHRDVAAPHGLTRLGPQRRRLSRAEWQAEQAQARATADAARKIHHDADTKAQAVLEQAEAEAERIKAEADADRQAARDERAAAQHDRQAARQEHQQAHAISVGIEAWADGRITGATHRDNGKRDIQYRNSLARLTTEREIQPAWHRVWSWVHDVSQRIQRKIDALASREHEVAERENAVAEREREIDRLEPYITEAREHAADAERGPIMSR